MTLIYYSPVIPNVCGTKGHAGFLVSTVIHVRVLEGASSLSAAEEAVRAEVFEGIWRA